MAATGYTSGDPNKVDVAGDTMTGALALPGAPVAPTQAATKAYADARQAAAEATAAAALAGHVAAPDPHGDRAYTDAAVADAESGGSTALAVHAADTTAVHGIADTAQLETVTGSGAKVAAHEADTTGVHGITDTAQLETVTGSAAKVAAHTIAVDPHGDRAYTGTAITAHSGASDPHGDRAAAVAAIATHAGATDPHADRAFATAAIAAHAAAVDPHADRAYTDTAVALRLAKASNLSDLANAGTARTNLGLGGAAVLAVGTTAGTVAAGDDSRLTDTRTPTDASVTNAKVAAGAAIALSKLATDPLARANHTGLQLAATISDFDAQVHTARLDQLAAPSGSVSFNGQRATLLGAPAAATDGANRQYVDDVLAGRYGSFNEPRGSDRGLIASNSPALTAITSIANTAGQVDLCRIPVRHNVLLSNVVVFCPTATAGTLTAVYLALFTPAGAQVAITADRKADFTAAGAKTLPFTTPYTQNLAANGTDWLWVAILAVGATFNLVRANITYSPMLNFGVAAATAHFATVGTGSGIDSGRTTIPASITPANNVLPTSAVTAWWVGLT